MIARVTPRTTVKVANRNVKHCTNEQKEDVTNRAKERKIDRKDGTVEGKNGLNTHTHTHTHSHTHTHIIIKYRQLTDQQY